jgi:folate-binding protein YgfZ
VLRATGPDAFAFLQSQCSVDLRNPDVENPVMYGLWLNQKGKIQADSFVIQRGPEEFLLVSYDCPAEKIRAHLEAHLIADEVELRDETREFALLHFWFDGQSDKVADLLDIIAEAAEADYWMGRRPRCENSWDLLADPSALEAVADSLAKLGANGVDAEALQGVRILAGVPAIPADAGPGDLPQEAGLERDAVSFDKGCYLGQEVMARLKSLGHVNRALCRVLMKGDAPFSAGNEPVPLYAGEVAAGELRSRAGEAGLAMLKIRAIAGRESLSLTPKGEEVVSLKAETAWGLTVPPTAAGQS